MNGPLRGEPSCTHPTINHSIVGLVCPSCRTRWKLDDPITVGVLHDHMQAKLAALEARLALIEEGMTGVLNLGSCEGCKQYHLANRLFHILGGRLFCFRCLCDALEHEDDPLEFDSVALHDGLVDQIAREALRLGYGTRREWATVAPDVQAALVFLRGSDGTATRRLTREPWQPLPTEPEPPAPERKGDPNG